MFIIDTLEEYFLFQLLCNSLVTTNGRVASIMKYNLYQSIHVSMPLGTSQQRNIFCAEFVYRPLTLEDVSETCPQNTIQLEWRVSHKDTRLSRLVG